MGITGKGPDLGMLTGQLMRAIQEELFHTLAEQGHPDVSPRHGTVLAFLDPGGTRATDLSARSGQHKQIVGTITDELARLGYVTRARPRRPSRQAHRPHRPRPGRDRQSPRHPRRD
ncbi:MarR family transcriptional regulator [Streptosporangium lutulentum]